MPNDDQSKRELPRPPKIYDVVPLPDAERGRECTLWTAEDPTPCGNEATYLFVYEVSLDPSSDKRGNCLCCAECKPEPVDQEDGRSGELVTDGGVDHSEMEDAHPAARNADQLAWAVWLGDRRTGECISVVADNEQRAKNKALSESDEDEVRGIDGPFQDGEPAYFRFTFHTEHREEVVVEAPDEDYAREAADADRNYSGEYIQTTHTEVQRVPKDD